MRGLARPSPRRRRRRLVGMALAISATAAPARAQDVAYWGTLQGATGDYEMEERSSSVVLLNGLTVDWRTLRLSLSVPVLGQSTPWITTSVPGSGAVPGSAPTAVDTSLATEVGLGDPLLSGSLALLRERGWRPEVRALAGVKAPLGSVARGLGTGAWDASAGLSLAKSLGHTLLLADASYWMLGDMSDVELRNVVSWGAAVGRPLGAGRWALLGSVYGSGAIVAGATAPVQTSLALSRFGEGGRLWSASVGFGLSATAPSLTAGFGWQLPLRREHRPVDQTTLRPARSP